MLLYVIAGHGAGDTGSVGCGRFEADMTRMIARRLSELGGDYVMVHDMADDAYQSGFLKTADFMPGTQVLEIHMDWSSDPNPHGAHVIISDRAQADVYDWSLARDMHALMPGRDEMLVRRDDLANPNICARRGIEYRLLECGFISNQKDVTFVLYHLDEICETILKVFGISGKEVRPMECLIRPDGEGRMVYVCGCEYRSLDTPDEMEAIERCYRECNGTEIPKFEFGSPEAPWASRLFSALDR